MRGHLDHGGGWDAIEDDRDSRGALGGRQQVLPRDRVGVPGGRSHEQPQVRCGQKLSGQQPVLRHDRIDVRGVEEREPTRQGGVRDELQRVGVISRVEAARQPGQDPVRGEVLSLIGVIDEDGAAGRGPDDARPGHDPAQQRVDEGGLPGTRGSADDGQQRRVQSGQPRQHIVVELSDHRLRRRRGRRGPRKRQGKTHVRQDGPQPGQCLRQRGCAHRLPTPSAAPSADRPASTPVSLPVQAGMMQVRSQAEPRFRRRGCGGGAAARRAAWAVGASGRRGR